VCNDCGSALVDALPPAPPEEYAKEVFFMTVSSTMEAEVIESRLRAFGIPVLKKYRDCSGYINLFTGASNLGVDLYVPDSAVDAASEILSDSPNPDSLNFDSLNPDSLNPGSANPDVHGEAQRTYQNSLVKIGAIIALPFLLVLLYTALHNRGLL
jgi:hypothetical protein